MIQINSLLTRSCDFLDFFFFTFCLSQLKFTDDEYYRTHLSLNVGQLAGAAKLFIASLRVQLTVCVHVTVDLNRHGSQ